MSIIRAISALLVGVLAWGLRVASRRMAEGADHIMTPGGSLGFLLMREPPGILSESSCWVLSDSHGYLYLHDRLLGLVRQVVTEWRHDRHMVG